MEPLWSTPWKANPPAARTASSSRAAPHLVLDGAQLIAMTIRAARVAVCVPAHLDDLAGSLSIAVSDRPATVPHPIPFEIERVPGRYLAGEESALVDWLDRQRGVPAFRPDKGLPLQIRRRPALVHNAETLAHVALITRFGGDPNSTDAYPDETGTTLVTVSGSVDRPGVYEIDLGTPLAEIIDRAQPALSPAAALIGGYGGTWVRNEHLGTPFSNSALAGISASRGAGVIFVLPPTACGIAETARIASYLADQSAGQCGPCLFGLPAITDDLRALAKGETQDGSVSRLYERMSQVTGRGACRHPDGAVRMVASALDVFEADVHRHLAGHPCPYHRGATLLPLPEH